MNGALVPQHLKKPAHPRLRHGAGIAGVLFLAGVVAMGMFLLLRPSASNHGAADADYRHSLSSSAHASRPVATNPPSSTSGAQPTGHSTAKKHKKHKPPSHRSHPSSPSSSHPGSSSPSAPSSSGSESHSSPPSSTPSAPAPSGSFADQVVALTNQQRAANGCPALTINANLTTAAQGHSTDMAVNNYFDHNSQNGETPWDRMADAGYTGWTLVGENIAEGQPSPQEVMDAWMNSEGHRANILNCGFTEIGVGYAKNSSATPYWTQDFGHRG